MSIFLDTSNAEEIEHYNKDGIIRGVTTNPSIILKNGLGRFSDLKEWAKHISSLINPLPLSIEVTSNNKEDIIRQSEEYASWAKNINVKVTIHDEEGQSNLQTINHLENSGISVNVTAMMSAQQCFLAALAGASYVSIFGGRVNNMGYNSVDEVSKLYELLVKSQLDSKIIVGSVRESMNITDWLIAGADIVTVPPSFLETMIVHPYTKETVKQFMDDSKLTT